MRNALTLQEKNLVTIHASVQNIIKLTKEGEAYAQNGLPERNLILATAQLGGTADLQTAAKQAGLQAAVHTNCARMDHQKKMGSLSIPKQTRSP